MIRLLLVLGFVVLAAPALAEDEAPLQEIFGRDHKIFVGCRPSWGECYNSCPDHRATAETDPSKCDPEDPRERVACYCNFRGET